MDLCENWKIQKCTGRMNMENNMHIQGMFVNMQNEKYLNIQKSIRDQKHGKLMFILAGG